MGRRRVTAFPLSNRKWTLSNLGLTPVGRAAVVKKHQLCQQSAGNFSLDTYGG